MKIYKFIWVVVVLSITSNLQAQLQDLGGLGWEVDPMPIRLKGKIISVGDGMPVPYAHIVNGRTHGGTTSNSGGYFTMDMLNVDSLAISAMGFLKKSYGVPYDYSPDSILIIAINPIKFAIGEVTVEGEKVGVNLGIPTGKPVDIDPELRGDAFNEKPPVIAALFNPISYWQYYLSKKEKRKRAVREAIALQRNWEMHSRNYNKEVVMMLTGINEKQADDFMIWFNGKNVLAYTASEYQVRSTIREYFMIYVREGRLK